jgi:hypothetical protein
MRMGVILFLLLGIDAAVLFFEASTLSITYHEAEILYKQHSVLHYIISASVALFGQNDFALRLPMMLMHLLSALFLFAVSKPYLKYDRDRLWLVLIFVLLPGVNSAALLVDSAGLVLLLLLVYLYLWQRVPKVEPLVLAAFVFVDGSFAFLYLGRFLYALAENKRRDLILNLVLFGASIYLFGFDTSGAPSGHFLDTLGIYAAVLSPIVFVYLVYVLYRRMITNKRDLIWYLSTAALLYSLIFSFRQRIEIEMFAPYLILALPLGAATFFHSYRVRLRMFRNRYRVLFTLSFVLLAANGLLVLFNQQLYRFVDDPKRHFAYRAHVAKELAFELKRMHIGCVDAAAEKQMQLRLRFYGIDFCRDDELVPGKNGAEKSVTISYTGVPIASYYVTNMHN